MSCLHLRYTRNVHQTFQTYFIDYEYGEKRSILRASVAFYLSLPLRKKRCTYKVNDGRFLTNHSTLHHKTAYQR